MNKPYYVDMRFLTTGHADEDEMESCLEGILEHLAELDNVIDPDLTASLSTGTVLFSVTVEAEDGGNALNYALSAVRTAAHACEVDTPGWESHFREVDQNVRAADAVELIDA